MIEKRLTSVAHNIVFFWIQKENDKIVLWKITKKNKDINTQQSNLRINFILKKSRKSFMVKNVA